MINLGVIHVVKIYSLFMTSVLMFVANIVYVPINIGAAYNITGLSNVYDDRQINGVKMAVNNISTTDIYL